MAHYEQISNKTSRLAFTARLRPQVRMRPVGNDGWTSCPILSSERAQIPIFRTCCILNLWTRSMCSFWMYLFTARLCYMLPAATGVVHCATVTDWMYTILPHMMRHRDSTKYTLASQSLLWQGDSLDAQYVCHKFLSVLVSSKRRYQSGFLVSCPLARFYQVLCRQTGYSI